MPHASLILAAALSACLDAGSTPQEADSVPKGNGLAPPGAPAGTCWGQITTPAVVETVTQRVLVKPAKTNPDGSIAELPVYRNEDRQQIVTPRGIDWFETPCPPAFTIEFVSNLQRALAVRGQYTGPITGNMDAPTRAAVRAVQRAEGLDSDILSIAAARRLGLVIAAAQ